MPFPKGRPAGDPGERPSGSDPATATAASEDGPELARIRALGGEGAAGYHREVARIGAEVAEALAYAYRRGVLHRDIKPSNLLLDGRGNAWVTDFGLAKFDGGETLTATGDVVGTLRYMSPERFEGTSDAGCDIYALGVTLYELLALRPAFEESHRANLIRRILTERPTALRRLDPRVSFDLETVVDKAMARDPRDRYATADELAAELRRVASGEPILARRVPRLVQFGRWCRRNPVVAGLTAISAALMAAVVVISSVTAVILARSNEDVRARLEEVKKAERARTDQLYAANRNEARAVILSKRPGQRFLAIDAIRRANELARTLDSPATKAAELRDLAISALSLPDLDVRTGFASPRPENVIDLDPGFRLYASANHLGEASIHRISDGGLVASLPVGTPPRVLRFAREGWVVDHESVVTGGRFRVWDLDGRGPESRLELANVLGFDIAADGRRAVAMTSDGAFRVHEVPSGRLLARHEPGRIRREPALRFHPFAPYFAASSYFTRDQFEIRHVFTGEIHRIPLPWDANGASSACWTDDGRTLAVSRGDGGGIALYAFDLVTAACRLLKVSRDPSLLAGLSLRFNGEGDRLYGNDWGRTFQAIDVSTLHSVFTTVVSRPLYDKHIRVEEGGNRLIPGVVDPGGGTYGIWSTAEGRESRIVPLIQAGGTNVLTVKVSPDGLLAAVVGLDGLLAVFETATWKELGRIRLPANEGRSISLDFDAGGRLYTNGFGGCFRWPMRPDPADPGLLRIGPPDRLPFHPGEDGISVSRDGRTVAQSMFLGYGMVDYAGAWLIGPDPAAKPRHLAWPSGTSKVEVSPDGRRMVVVSPRNLVELFDTRSGKPIRTYGRDYHWAAFHPDGRLLLVRGTAPDSIDHIETWLADPETGDVDRKLTDGHIAHPAEASPFAIMDDREDRLRLVDTSNGAKLAAFVEPFAGESTCNRARLTPRGDQLIVPHTQGLRVWNLHLLRNQLRELGLDWDEPELPAPVASRLTGVRFEGALLLDPRIASLAEGLDGLRAPYVCEPPGLSRAFLAQGKVLHRLGWVALAEDRLDRAIRLDPRSSDALAERGTLRFGQGRWADAERDLSRAIELGGPAPPLLFRRAWSRYERGLAEPALRDLEDAIELPTTEYPRRYAFLALRAEIQAQRGDMSRARQELARLQEKLNDPAGNLVLNVRKMLDAPRSRRADAAALALARRADTLKPGDPFVASVLGKALLRSGHFAESRRVLEASIAAQPGTHVPFDLVQLSLALNATGDRAAALATLGRLATWRERIRGWPQADRNAFERAEVEARWSLGLDPGDPIAAGDR